MEKNTIDLVIFEWFLWILFIPIIILLIIAISTRNSFIDLFFSLLPGGSNVFFSFFHLIIIGLIVAPICSYYGFLTLPIKKLRYKEEFEKEKKEIINLIYKVTHQDKKTDLLLEKENTKKINLKWKIILIILTVVTCGIVILFILRIFGYI